MLAHRTGVGVQRFAIPAAIAIAVAAMPVKAVRAQTYADMSIKELMNVNVTSVSRYPQPVRDVAAAVTVLTAQDIRRAGVTSVPDALRLVPGVNVAQINAGSWAVTARGFNSRNANKLLVMIDGRPVYSHFISGVVWHRQDLPLANIKRIEVVRGPGGAIWGANAVNGVINIITRDSGETQGTYGELTAGNVERGMGVLRHGGRIGRGTYRVTAKARRRVAGSTTTGTSFDDHWTTGQVRFRADTPLAGGDMTVTAGARKISVPQKSVQVDPTTYRPTERETTDKATKGHLMAQWGRMLPGGGSMRLVGFYDHTTVNNDLIRIFRDRVELRGRHRFSPAPAHDLAWGIRLRGIRERIDDTFALGMRDDGRWSTRLSAFVQDTITLEPGLDLIVGSKISYNSYSGVEIQPNVRTRWRLSPRHMVWGSVSRAVRVPSRTEFDGRLRGPTGTSPQGLPIVTVLHGRDGVEATNLRAFEAGYRGRPLPDTRLSVSSFYNRYTDLLGARAVSRRVKRNPSRVIVNADFVNRSKARAVGVEAEASWQVTRDWRLRATYTFLDLSLSGDTVAVEPGCCPSHQGTLQSRWRPRKNLTIDATFRAVDELRDPVRAYADLDLRVGWKVSDGLTVSLTGRNLIGGERAEFPLGDVPGFYVTRRKRSVFATVQARF